LANASIRSLENFSSADPASQVLATMFQSFWGQPFPGSFASLQGYFQEQWVYVGVIAVALSVVAVALRWRRPEVIALAAATAVAVVASIFEPANQVLNKLPLIGHSWWNRSLIPLAFCLAMLAGIGLDATLRGAERRRAARWALGTFGGIALLLGLIWLFGRGHLSPHDAHVRAKSFIWPVASTAVGLAAFGALVLTERPSIKARWHWTGRRARLLTLAMAGFLLTCQTVFLIIDDSVIPSSASAMYPPIPAVSALQHAVGSSLVGLGQGPYIYTGGLGLGLAPNTNVPYGIDQFAEYDPITPSSWFPAWLADNKTSSGNQGVYEFIPAIDSATVARRYGISYVLEPRGAAGPRGSVFDTRVGNEDLYRIPGAATATLVPESSSAEWPATDAPGRAVAVHWPAPAELRVATDAPTPQVLRLRVASFPGWQATMDGRPLALKPYLSMMLQAKIPPGKHVIQLRYWPKRFTQGIVIAALAVLGFAIAGIIIVWRRRVRTSVKGTSPA
jgi:hypothetical protein